MFLKYCIKTKQKPFYLTGIHPRRNVAGVDPLVAKLLVEFDAWFMIPFEGRLLL